MRFFFALVSLCAFAWLGYMVFIGGAEATLSSIPQAEVAVEFLMAQVETYGQSQIALACLGAGAVLSFLVIAIGNRGEA